MQQQQQQQQQQQHQHQQHHPMVTVGGYSPIPDLSSNPRVQDISVYVLDTLMTDTKENTNRYSFQSEFVNNNNNSNNNNNCNHTDPVVTWDVIVVLGNQQVVAGMNYHLTMVVVVTRRNDNNENETDTNQTNSSSSSSSSSEHIRDRQPEVATQVVVGGFDVVVYDQFGTLSITRWGKELSIPKAQELWTDYNNSNNHHQPDEEKANVKVDDDTDMTNTNAILDSEGT
jgi:hypothetical protein